jgi:putative sterol carrier protein
MTAAEESYNATAALGDMLKAFSPEAKEKAESDAGMTVKGVFDRMPEFFQSDKAAGVDVVFQYRITGPTGGEWHVVIEDAKCEVFEGTHDKPTTTIIMSDEDFLSLIGGQLNAMQAFTSGKLKVEGDLMKSQLIEKLFKF